MPLGGSATRYSYADQGQGQWVSAESTSFQYDVTGLNVMTTDDGLSSTLAMANSTGSVANSYSYDPFGNATSATEQVANPYRFDGQYLDQATGFYKMGRRSNRPLWVSNMATPRSWVSPSVVGESKVVARRCPRQLPCRAMAAQRTPRCCCSPPRTP